MKTIFYGLLSFFLFSTVAMAQPLSDLNFETLKKYQKQQTGDNTAKNPFVPGVQTLNDISIQDLILSGTIKGEAQSWALVNGQIISKGEKLAGYDVEDIRDGVVVLKQGNLTFELKLSGL